MEISKNSFKNLRRNKKRIIYFLWLTVFLLFFTPFNPLINNFFGKSKDSVEIPNASLQETSEIESILWKISPDMLGSFPSVEPIVGKFTEDGENNIIVGTDGGIVIIALDGSIVTNYITHGRVIGIDIIQDISGDSQKDILVVVLDKIYANVIAISSSDGEVLWKFNPITMGFDFFMMDPEELTTRTWDIANINDVDGDGYEDVVFSSWNRLYALSGVDGTQIWCKEDTFSDDIWKIEIIDDINGNGYQEIIAGSEAGEVFSVDSRAGTVIWKYVIPQISFSTIDNSGFTQIDITRSFTMSVADLMLISDVNNDEVQEIIVAGEDGKIRILSGKNGILLEEEIIIDIEIPTTPGEYDGERYNYEERLFSKSGIRIFKIPDLNSDEIDEIGTYSFDLKIGTESSEIECKIFDISSNEGENYLNEIALISLPSVSFSKMSYPYFANVNSENRIYFDNPQDDDSNYSQGVFYFPFNLSATSIITPNITSGFSLPYKSDIIANSYIINVGDVTDDGADDIFGFNKNGHFYLLDLKEGKIIWDKSKPLVSTQLTQIQDLGSDGINDLLIQYEEQFTPEWDPDQNDPDAILMREIKTVNATNGEIIWKLNLESSIYKGIRNLENVGDLTGDNINDFAAWIIPSKLPSSLAEKIGNNFGNEDFLRNCRAELVNYTKIIAIDGRTGEIFLNQSFLSDPYTNNTLLDFKIHDFKTINGTDDSHLDVLATFGYYNEYPTSYNNSIILFDIQTNQSFVKWGYLTQNTSSEIRIVSFNNTINYGWFLAGKFTDGVKPYYIKRVNESFWENPLSDIEYNWEYNWNITDFEPFIYSRLVQTTVQGDFGFLVLVDNSGHSNDYFQIRSLENSELISMVNLFGITGIDGADPDDPIPKKQIVLSVSDFNGDNYLDHVSSYRFQPEQDSAAEIQEVRIYSGNSKQPEGEILYKFSITEDSPFNKEDGKYFTSLEDFEGSNNSVLLFGLQGLRYSVGYSIFVFNLEEDNASEIIIDRYEMFAGYYGHEFSGSLENIGDLNGDGINELLASRTIRSISDNGFWMHETESLDIIDLKNREIFAHFTNPIEDFQIIEDLDGDGKNEYLLVYEETVLCMNSKFDVEIIGIINGTKMNSNNFIINWDTNSSYSHFEIFINGNSQGITTSKNLRLSLGTGLIKVDILMYDNFGIVAAFDSVYFSVQSDDLMMWIVTIIGIIVIVGITMFYQKLKRTRMNLELKSDHRNVEMILDEKEADKDENLLLKPNMEKWDGLYEIWAKDLTKIYDKKLKAVTAVDRINLKIEPGVHGFVGPNGAGKTTTINMLIGAISTTNGEAKIRNYKAGTIVANNLVGFLPQSPIFYRDMTGKDYLVYFGRLGGLTSEMVRLKVRQLLEYFDILDVQNRQIKKYSGGMKQKLGLAAALIHNPKILILDEPTANMDPIGRQNIIDLIKKLGTKMSVFISSHILAEIELMCDKVTVINQGKIIISDTIDNIKNLITGDVYLLNTNNNSEIFKQLQKDPNIKRTWINEEKTGDHYINIIPENAQLLEQNIPSLIAQNKARMLVFKKSETSLQDVFMKLIENKKEGAKKNEGT